MTLGEWPGMISKGLEIGFIGFSAPSAAFLERYDRYPSENAEAPERWV